MQGVPRLYIRSFTVFTDLHCTIKFCKVHHFTNDTNLIKFQTSVKTINKQISYDIKTY